MKLPFGFGFSRRGPQAAQSQPDPKAAGLPNVLNARSALSAAVLVASGISGSPNSEVDLIANWDAREDYTADRANKVENNASGPTSVVTRTAISEHTYSNGFNENVYYYGDATGNFWIGTDASPGTNNSPTPSVDSRVQINLPQLVNTNTSGGVTLNNPTANDCSDSTSTVTGIAVNPVADLGDFGAAYCGVIGEVVYVSAVESTGCATNAANQPFHTRIFAFGFTDTAGGVSPVGALQLLRSQFYGNGGIAVDDDGSLYFHLANVANPSAGAAIFKATELSRTVSACAPNNPRINRVITTIPAPPAITSWQGTGSNPVLTSASYRYTNYSGPATTFGNIVAIAAGPANVIYAAVARSFNTSDDTATKVTEGAYTNPAALGATPSMVISFADTGGTLGFTSPFAGAFDACSSPNAGTVAGALPIGDGIADVAQAGQTYAAGVNNFRVFVMGNGPDIRAVGSSLSATPTNTLPNIDLQIDYSIYAGLMVDEEGTVFVVSGGTPALAGTNPSPSRGEILAFPDQNARDRRADYLDLRGDVTPNPPASGGNVGDGDSDRFDHIYWQAPLDGTTATPVAIAGISRGFLLYTNRTRDRNTGTLANLPNGATQTDDATAGPLVFEDFDGGHQVAGGDDQNTPFRGDDNDGAGNPAIPGALNGGFEYNFGGPVGTANAIWNAVFLNSNGNLTFGAGDTDGSSSEAELRSGSARVAAAWANLNPDARAVSLTTFPVQAIGFSDVNAFKVRWINVPEAGSEACGSRNTFAATLYDDGTGIDEDANQPLNPANPIGNNAVPYDLQEGPTDLRFIREPNSQLLIGAPPRREGTGFFCLEFGRMDLLGTAADPVLVGYSIGNLSPTNPPGVCEINLGAAAVAADASPFFRGLIGSGTETTVFEFFDSGTPPSAPSTVGIPDFDLRFEGNDPALGTAASQPDPNRGYLCFFGTAAAPPQQPINIQITPTNPLVTPPGQTGLVNSLCEVSIDITGVGFFPNEATTICEGGSSRAGKTVSTTATLRFDADGNSVPEVTITLTNVTVISSNLIRATVPKLNDLPGTAFPVEVLGGGSTTLTLTTTETAGDNNVFGPFTRTAVGVVPQATVGKRAPLVFSVTPTGGNPAGAQMVTIAGADFKDVMNANTVTSVFAVEQGNPLNVVQATSFTVQSSTQIDATFDFGGAANAGKTFLIFVSGPNGTSRNLLPPAPAGTPAGCVLGNEAGNVVTFTTNACVTSLTPTSQNVSGAGGGGSIAVTATTGCGWTAVSNAAFIHVTSGSPGTGDGTVTFTVDANPGPARSGTITIGELTFTVNQAVGCSFMIAPTSQSFAAAGGTGTVNVTASDASCPWTATSNDAWITVTSGATGTGNGTVGYSVAANAGPARSGTITIAGQTFTVTQATGCTFTINPTNQSFAAAGGTGTVNVTASDASCPWTATSNDAWITVTSGATGTGNGTVGYSVAANVGPARAGTITIAGQTFTVNQGSGCTFTINPTNQSFAAAGGTGTVTVTASDAACTRTATSNDAWITVTAGATGTGSGTVNYSVAANAGLARTGTITIAGQTFTVNQASGCSFTIAPTSQNFTLSGGNGSVIVTASDAACPWTATSNDAWITVTAGATGTGNGTVLYTVAANPGAPRSGTITIAGQTFTVTQGSGCSFTINPTSQSFGAGATTGSVAVTASDSGCAWTATSNASWLVLTTSSGTGNGSANFMVQANTGPARTGTIFVAGQTFTATQASGCPTITISPALPGGVAGVPYNQTLTASGGVGPYTFTASSGLPPGLTLSSDGTLSGTPTQAGSFPFIVTATASNGCQGTRVYTVDIVCPTISVTPATVPNGFVGTAYNASFAASGGTAAYTFTVSAGALPAGLMLSSGGVLSGTPTAAGTFSFTVKATDANGCMGTSSYTIIVSGAGLMFYPLAHPVRLLDTRPGQTGCDAPGAAIPGGTSRTQTAAGRTCDGLTIPAGARALAGNITTVESGGGFLTLYPSDVAQPTVANSNYGPNEIVNNVFTVGLGAGDGAFKIFVQNTTNVVVDVTGYYAPPGAGGLYFHPLPKPVRLLETRAGFTGCTAPGAPLPGNTETTQQARGVCDGVTIPATALAIVGNATTVNPQGTGPQFLTLYPADVTRPLAASSNYLPGQVMNAPFTVGLSSTGAFKVFPTTQTDLVVDVLGYYSPEVGDVNGAGLLFNPLSKPVRLLETRTGFTGCFTTNAPLAAGSTRTQPARGLCDGVTVAANALAIVGNATVVLPQSNGYLTLWPSGATQPTVAASNFTAGQVFNRHFTVGLGSSDGAFNIFTSATTNLVIDVSGFFAP